MCRLCEASPISPAQVSSSTIILRLTHNAVVIVRLQLFLSIRKTCLSQSLYSSVLMLSYRLVSFAHTRSPTFHHYGFLSNENNVDANKYIL